MQFRLMRNFIMVAEELHMHRAAERLNMAQPALSQQIKTLEDRLGVLLFSRANRRLTLTPAGEAFLSKARVSWMWPLFVPRYRYCLTICKAVHLQRKRPCWPYLVNMAWRAPPR